MASEDRGRLASLDGLRGIAIILVLVHHSVCWSNQFAWNVFPHSSIFERAVEFFSEWASSGVDLFFILSGFLITRILVSSKDDHQYFRNFYVRRVLRIFPLYYAYLFCVFYIVPLVCRDPVLNVLRNDQFYYWTYVSNFVMTAHNTASNMFLLHTWSLSVEEQFYLVWPFVVRRFSSRTLTVVLFLMFAASTVFRFSLFSHTGSAFDTHINTFARLDTFAIGAFLAMSWRNGSVLSPIKAMILMVACLAGCAAVVKFAPQGRETIGLLFLTVGYAAVLAAALGGCMKAALTSKPLMFFGKYSYSIYLVHFPLVYATQHFLLTRIAGHCTAMWQIWAFEFSVVTASSVVLAMLSFRYFEKPFLDLKDKLAPYPSRLESPVESKRLLSGVSV